MGLCLKGTYDHIMYNPNRYGLGAPSTVAVVSVACPPNVHALAA